MPYFTGCTVKSATTVVITTNLFALITTVLCKHTQPLNILLEQPYNARIKQHINPLFKCLNSTVQCSIYADKSSTI